MNKTLRQACTLATACIVIGANAQRYTSDVFTDADIITIPDITFGQNIDFLTSDFSNQAVFGPEVIQLQTLVSTQQPIPAPYFDPNDETTALKVANLRMDVYQPNTDVDCDADRALFIFVHTGNALPPPLNGSPTGTRKDSSAVEVCKRMARRGYVAVSMSYRAGWNPLGATLEIRRGTLLNAIYRAIHDVKQCIRYVKSDAGSFHINPEKILLYGEGTGGYITLATATLDEPAELFIEKFRPDPFDENVSYIDTTLVGNIEGFGGQLCLYRPNGQNSDFQMCVNAGGALADTSWLAPGDVPMVAFHTVFDPFAPFTEGTVIVPTTGEQVVPVQGSNFFIPLANQYGNNAVFAGIPDGDPFTDRARALYGTTQTHLGGSVNIAADPTEGLFPLVTMDWPGMGVAPFEEASPWQWWDPAGPLANIDLDGPGPGTLTTGQASQASNPNFSGAKGRAYIDTIVNYLSPRAVLALGLSEDIVGVGDPCDDGDPNTEMDAYIAGCICQGLQIGIGENSVANGLDVMPNPVHDMLRVTSANGTILGYELFDATGRRVRAEGVNARQFTVDRAGLQAGAYYLGVQFENERITRKVTLD